MAPSAAALFRFGCRTPLDVNPRDSLLIGVQKANRVDFEFDLQLRNQPAHTDSRTHDVAQSPGGQVLFETRNFAIRQGTCQWLPGRLESEGKVSVVFDSAQVGRLGEQSPVEGIKNCLVNRALGLPPDRELRLDGTHDLFKPGIRFYHIGERCHDDNSFLSPD